MQHLQRWLTAIVLVPLVLWIIVKGTNILVAALVSVVAIFAIREYLRIICGNEEGPVSQTIKIISYTVSMILVMGACLSSWQIIFLILALNLMTLCVFVLLRFSRTPRVFDLVARQVLGIVYIPLALAMLVFIHAGPGGVLWIIWLLIVCFANDTGAFYAGTFFGRHKLAPKISPNKTIEGSVGGATASVIAGFVFCLIFFSDLSIALLCIPCALIMAVAGQIGDLFESAMKRVHQVKDSGRILPGHGGMLDRIDGLLLAVPVLYAFLVLIQ
ncbi:MAG: phosphatidate cytidylyltransferase [Desulfobacter sp.]|nr:MAG: phosphatidate cytidylyltransferase [Desulfobacter sp.]